MKKQYLSGFYVDIPHALHRLILKVDIEVKNAYFVGAVLHSNLQTSFRQIEIPVYRARETFVSYCVSRVALQGLPFAWIYASIATQ